jgi:hypothetical protein
MGVNPLILKIFGSTTGSAALDSVLRKALTPTTATTDRIGIRLEFHGISLPPVDRTRLAGRMNNQSVIVPVKS